MGRRSGPGRSARRRERARSGEEAAAGETAWSAMRAAGDGEGVEWEGAVVAKPSQAEAAAKGRRGRRVDKIMAISPLVGWI